MSKTTTQTAEKKPNLPGLPSFLTVGNGSRERSTRSKVGPEQLRKLFGWWDQAQPVFKETGAGDVGIPAIRLAEEFKLQPPTNGNSFRANLQRILDQMNLDGKTMFLSLRGAEGDKFKITPETMIWFHPVSANERASLGKK